MEKGKKKPGGYYPLFLNLQDQPCVVVGGGRVALRKVKMLLDYGAHVSVISPAFNGDFAQLAKRKAMRLIRRNYKSGDLKGAEIVVAATDARNVNLKIAQEAKRAGALVNVVDDPEHSNFIVPSFLRRGHLTIAVSTGGRSPALARKIRTQLEQDFGREYGSLLSLIEEVRRALRSEGLRVSPETWQEILDLESLIHLVRSGQQEKAKALLMEKLKHHPAEERI
jgi:precorrin-2 dehydrogenase/sirohydrochlorin ferrochelatase